jgi:hypothetical protein
LQFPEDVGWGFRNKAVAQSGSQHGRRRELGGGSSWLPQYRSVGRTGDIADVLMMYVLIAALQAAAKSTYLICGHRNGSVGNRQPVWRTNERQSQWRTQQSGGQETSDKDKPKRGTMEMPKE